MEIDEYIYLKNYKNIKNFLNLSTFKNCQRIQLNWLFHTDNNQLYYDNKPLNRGIKDIDIIYYDSNNLTKEFEKELENNIIEYFKDFNY